MPKIYIRAGQDFDAQKEPRIAPGPSLTDTLYRDARTGDARYGDAHYDHAMGGAAYLRAAKRLPARAAGLPADRHLGGHTKTGFRKRIRIRRDDGREFCPREQLTLHPLGRLRTLIDTVLVERSVLAAAI